MAAIPSNCSRTDVQDKVDKVLARAGLRASPLDPLSLQALHDYLADKEIENVPSEQRQQQYTSHSPLNDSTTTYSSRDDRLMEQLQLQTSLILDLQRKINNLSGRVQELEKRDVGPVSNSNGSASHIAQSNETSHYAADNAPPRLMAPAAAEDNVNEDEDAVPVQRQQQRQRQQAGVVVIQESRLIRLVRLYGQLRRQQVPNFEWGVLFKVAIMMAILFSRMGADLNNMPLKFHALGMVLFGGFLLQTGYAQFLYKFIVEENYVYRIMVLNEDVAPPVGAHPMARPRGRGADAAAAADDGWFDWRETFLGGRIHRGEDAAEAPLLWRFFKEIGLFLMSFVLSIFPMWHPEPPPPQEENPANNTPEPAQEQNQQDGGPGLVQPPVDPAEPEDDEDE